MGSRAPALAAAALFTSLMLSPLAAAQPATDSAKAAFLLKCSGCHRPDGQGVLSGGVPPFPGFIGALAADPGGRAYMLHVPGVTGSGLKDADLAAVLNYLLDEWSALPAGRIRRFTPDEVAALRAQRIDDIVSYRRTLVARLRKSGAPIADYPWP